MKIENVRQEILRRAQLFCCDNMDMVGKIRTIETAMLIGASIVLEQPINDAEEDLTFTPEAEELFRQLFEGPPCPAEQKRKTYLETKP